MCGRGKPNRHRSLASSRSRLCNRYRASSAFDVETQSCAGLPFRAPDARSDQAAPRHRTQLCTSHQASTNLCRKVCQNRVVEHRICHQPLQPIVLVFVRSTLLGVETFIPPKCALYSQQLASLFPRFRHISHALASPRTLRPRRRSVYMKTCVSQSIFA